LEGENRRKICRKDVFYKKCKKKLCSQIFCKLLGFTARPSKNPFLGKTQKTPFEKSFHLSENGHF